ncbi:MAG: cysteine hydrolase family protein [Candidatus Thorarchaeota archaeon]
MVDKTALLIIDVQNGLFTIENFPIYHSKDLLTNLQNLIKKARNAKVPIFYIQHNESKGKRLETGSENWKIRSEITPRDEDIIIQKYNSDSFFDTPLDEELKKLGISRLVVAGLATPMCIDTTVRSAVSHGYKVILIEDAHSTIDSEILKASQIIAHHNDILQWFSTLKKAEEFEF